MLVTDKNASPIRPLKIVRNGILFFGIGALIYFLLIPLLVLRPDKNADPNIIYCDAENTFRGQFITNGNRFSEGDQQRDKYSNSGEHSCLLVGKNGMTFTLGHQLKDVKAGDVFEFSVWYYQPDEQGPAFLVATNEAAKFYVVTDQIKTTNKKGWSQLWMRKAIPKDFNGDDLRVFVYTTHPIHTYFDDLKIERIPLQNETASPTFNPQSIGIELNEKQYNKIKTARNRAFEEGLIITREDSWAKGKLIDGTVKKEASVRLKGDWLDHLQGNKWSFRVKLKDSYTFNRLVTFSVHTPAARYHVAEWLLHKFWENENVLTTRYDFLNLKLNDEDLGIYAYEEHFEKQLVESKSRREGPILKFSEEALWDLRLHQMETEKTLNSETIAPAANMEHAKINAFKESKIFKSEALSQQYAVGKQLLYQFQTGTNKASEIFDVELMANYLAITDLTGAYHTLIWHNMRFYYNPISGKLEPIGFDGFVAKPTPMPKLFAKETRRIEGIKNLKALLRIFDDPIMVEAYMQAMFRITEENYLKDFIEKMRPAYNARKQFVRKEFSDFNYRIDDLYNRAELVRANYLPLTEHTLDIKWVKQKGNKDQIEVTNLGKLPISINGFGGAKQLTKRRILQTDDSQLLTPSIGSKMVYFKVPGVDSLFANNLPTNTKWSNISPIQKLNRFKTLPSADFYKLEGNKVIFKKGNYEVNQNIIIPKNHEVIFESGCQLNFSSNTMFLSQSPVTMNGTSDQPINITCKDGTVKGFTVLKAGQKSNLSYVNFDGFNTLDYDGWKLTGAVTFYESDVDIKHSSFSNAVCEDALNIVYANFNLENITLDGAASDGFDADFCKGNIINSVFKNTSNDGVDVSGSQVLIEQCIFNNCGDKAISIGEESEAYLKDITIEKAIIGVASKDLSECTIESIILKDCNQGFAAYQKKPEFGTSLIVVDDYEADDVKYLYKLGFGSRLQLGSRLIVGEGK